MSRVDHGRARRRGVHPRSAGDSDRDLVVVVVTAAAVETRRRNAAAMRRVFEACHRPCLAALIPAPRQALPTAPGVELQPVT